MKTTRVAAFFVLALLQALIYADDELPPTLSIRLMATDITQKMATAAVADCARRGYQVSAAVVDRTGNLAAFLRHPLAGPHTIKVSQRKAFTSATVKAATSEMSRRPDLRFAPDILLIVGGVPIEFSGHFYGGVAVAGAPPEVDEQCALAGIAAVSDVMDFVE